MARVSKKGRVEEILRTKARRGEWGKTLRNLPDDVDVALATRAALAMFHYGGPPVSTFVRYCKKLPPSVIQSVLEALEQKVGSPQDSLRYVAIFLVELLSAEELDDEELSAWWFDGLTALDELHSTYAWTAYQFKDAVQALAQDEYIVAALRAVAVGCESLPASILAVLAAEASDASIDALLPHFDRAGRHRGEAEFLKRLRTHADMTNPTLKKLLDDVQTTTKTRRKESRTRPLALASAIGIEIDKVFWFDATMVSSRDTVEVAVDSRRRVWFFVSLTRGGRSTEISSDGIEHDDLNLGACQAEDFPQWLRGIRKKWTLKTLRSNVRGKKRSVLKQWLLGLL